MKILIVPDSFKETLTALQAGEAMRRGVQQVMPDASIEVLPFSDGGEGFTEVCFRLAGGSFFEHEVLDAAGNPIAAKVLVLPDGIGVMEVAEASGLHKLQSELRNPLKTSSYGSGQLLKFLMDRGCKEIWIGLGGSAVNDGGGGLLQALGVEFFDRKNEISGIPYQLKEVTSIDLSTIDARWNKIKIVIASDVENILLGVKGATYTFAKQKGATDQMLPALEERMRHWQQLMTNATGVDHSTEPGSGAAGGIGYALLHARHVKRTSGFELLSELCDLRKKIQDTDLILTGEGKFDTTSTQGKLVGRILKMAKEEQKSAYVFCGKQENNDIQNIFEISEGLSFEEAKEKAEVLLEKKVVEVFKRQFEFES
jgi:glycerate 2-kinase